MRAFGAHGRSSGPAGELAGAALRSLAGLRAIHDERTSRGRARQHRHRLDTNTYLHDGSIDRSVEGHFTRETDAVAGDLQDALDPLDRYRRDWLDLPIVDTKGAGDGLAVGFLPRLAKGLTQMDLCYLIHTVTTFHM